MRPLFSTLHQSEIRFRGPHRSSKSTKSRFSFSGDSRLDGGQLEDSASDTRARRSIMGMSKSPANKRNEKSVAERSPPPALSPLNPMPALDMTEYGAQLYSESDAASQHSPLHSLRVRHNADQVSTPTKRRASANSTDAANSAPARDDRAGPIISRSSHHAATRRVLPPSPALNGTIPHPSPAHTVLVSMNDYHEAPSDIPPLPTSPTAAALSELGPPPGNGPKHERKMRTRISIWAEEVSQVNLTQPTKPMPKPLREWGRLSRRILKRRDHDEWPGPMQDGERVDKTGMYEGRRREVSDDAYWGPHPGLNRGDGLMKDRGTSPTPRPQTPETPGAPTRNILIDDLDGAADLSDEMKLSASNSDGEVDMVEKAKKATTQRLDRAAKLLAKQTKAKGNENDKQPSSDESSGTPVQAKKRHMDEMEWRMSLGQKKV